MMRGLHFDMYFRGISWNGELKNSLFHLFAYLRLEPTKSFRSEVALQNYTYGILDTLNRREFKPAAHRKKKVRQYAYPKGS